MGLRQPGGLTRRLAVDEAFSSLGVELEHPVAHDLQAHPADPRGLGARSALIDRRERQKPPRLGSVRGLASECAKLTRIKIRPEWDWHGKPPWFTKLNHTHPSSRNHERVTPSGNWYDTFRL